jgi:site-specific recombinase XerD
MEVIDRSDTVPLISNQRYNAYLKELQKLANIKTNITTHLLRKSYAHFLLNNGVRLETISRCMGHSSTTITAKVYCRQTTETIAEEISKILP